MAKTSHDKQLKKSNKGYFHTAELGWFTAFTK